MRFQRSTPAERIFFVLLRWKFRLAEADFFFFSKHFVRQLHITKPVLAEDNKKHVNYELSIKQRGQEETNLRIIS